MSGPTGIADNVGVEGVKTMVGCCMSEVQDMMENVKEGWKKSRQASSFL